MLNGKKNKIIVGSVVYNHPNTSLQCFLDHFSKILDKVHKESKLCVDVVGDFNINLLSSDSHA